MDLKDSKSILTILSITAFILLILLVLDFYYIRTQNKKTAQMLNLADQARENEALAQSVRLLQNTASEDIESLNNLGLTTNRLVSTIESIENAGQALDLDTEIVSVNQLSDQDGSGPRQILIVVETEGSWAESFGFLRAMESMPTRVLIKQTSFSKGETDWRSSVTLLLYSFD